MSDLLDVYKPREPCNNDIFDYIIKDGDKQDDDFLKDVIQCRNEEPPNEIDSVANAIEERLSIYDANKSNQIDLNDRDDYIRQNFDIEAFFRSNTKLYESANVLAETSFEDLFFNIKNENVLFTLVVIREKVNKAYLELIKPLEQQLNIANSIINNNISIAEASKEESWNAYKIYAKNSAPYFIEYVRELPGFEGICQHDFNSLVDDNVSLLFGFRIAKLYINDDLYLVLGNLRVDRLMLNQFYGIKMSDFIFDFHKNLNGLNLTNYELALLIPFILTIIGQFF